MKTSQRYWPNGSFKCRKATVRPVLGESPPGHVHLSSAMLLNAYGTNGTLNATSLQQAFAAIIACQVKCAAGHRMQVMPIIVIGIQMLRLAPFS